MSLEPIAPFVRSYLVTMLPLLLVSLAAQVSDAGTPPLTVIASERVVAVPAHDLVVFHHRQGVCLENEAEACGQIVVDRDRHTLRAVAMANGKERWRNETHPLLLGEVRRGDVVESVVATNRSGASVALLDPETGRARATCSPRGLGESYWRFSGALVDEGGDLVLQRRPATRGGAEPPPAPSLRLRVRDDGTCTLDETPRAVGGRSPSQGHPFVLGGTGARGWMEVTIGRRTHRLVIDVAAPPCRRFFCRPIP